jgi:adenosine kinase
VQAVPARGDIELAIVAPDGRDAMIQHAEQLKAAGIPFVFDPGQGLPMFNGDELLRFVDQATWVAVNDYEGKMLADRTGLSLAEISQRANVKGLIETLGAEGCRVWTDGQAEHVQGLKAAAVVDPTGCGDAFRGGLLFGLSQGWPLARCVALGNQMGCAKIEQAGPQNYQVDRAAVLARV